MLIPNSLESIVAVSSVFSPDYIDLRKEQFKPKVVVSSSDSPLKLFKELQAINTDFYITNTDGSSASLQTNLEHLLSIPFKTIGNGSDTVLSHLYRAVTTYQLNFLNTSSLLSQSDMILLLALHDIGKGLNSNNQKLITCAIVNSLVEENLISFEQTDLNLVRSLLSGELNFNKNFFQKLYKALPNPSKEIRDFENLGDQEKKKALEEFCSSLILHEDKDINPKEIITEFINLVSKIASRLEVDPREYYKVACILFCVDTGSYMFCHQDHQQKHGGVNFESLYEVDPEFKPSVSREYPYRFVFRDKIELLVQKLDKAIEELYLT